MNNDRFKSSSVIAGCMRWGAWGARFETGGFVNMIEGCLNIGINTFDHADIYGGNHQTEIEFGKALKEMPSVRERMSIISKCGIRLPDKISGYPIVKHYDTSSEHIINTVEESLRALRTDRIDLLLIHRPDPLMDPEVVAEAFHQLKQDGKVLHFGVSNFKSSQLSLLNRFWPLEINQIQISVDQPSTIFDGTMEKCRELGIGIQAWSPFGGGVISDLSDDERIRKIHAVTSMVAARYGCGVSEVLMAWLNTIPGHITPVLGSSKMDRLKKVMESRNLKLQKEEWFMILRASTGRDVA